VTAGSSPGEVPETGPQLHPDPYRPPGGARILDTCRQAGEPREGAVNCPNCGGAAQQGPDGSWSCPQCGPISGLVPGPRVGSPS